MVRPLPSVVRADGVLLETTREWEVLTSSSLSSSVMVSVPLVLRVVLLSVRLTASGPSVISGPSSVPLMVMTMSCVSGVVPDSPSLSVSV